MRSRAWLVLALSTLVWAPGAAADVTPDYYPFPTGYKIANWGVAADGAGNVWFTAEDPQTASRPVPSLARLVPAQASPGTSDGIGFFPLPDPSPVNCCANQVKSVTFNPKDGKLYYVRNDGGIGSGIPASLVPGTATGFTSTTLPNYQSMLDVAPSPAGGVWFTEYGGQSNTPPFYGNRIAYYDGSVTRGPEHRDPGRQHGAQRPALRRQAGGHCGHQGRPAMVRRGGSGQSWLPRRDVLGRWRPL